MTAIIGSVVRDGMLPVLLAHAFFKNPANFPDRGTSLNGDVQVPKFFPIHEFQTFFCECLTLALNALGFAVVVVVVVFHSFSVVCL